MFRVLFLVSTNSLFPWSLPVLSFGRRCPFSLSVVVAHSLFRSSLPDVFACPSSAASLFVIVTACDTTCRVSKVYLKENFIKMSQARVFSLLGDSNVVRNLTPFNCRDRPLMTGAQLIPCGRMDVLAESLRQVRAESNVILMVCVTNFLTRSDSAQGTISQRIESILLEFLRLTNEFALATPEVVFLVSPPMYRMFPIWYRDGMPEVLKKFSDIMGKRAPNVHLLPSFATPSLESDGIHLTAYSGLEFVVHLFDSSVNLIDSLASKPEKVLTQNCESSRVLEDRMMALEQDHRRLNSVVESKTAEDAELAEMHENIMFEDHFMIAGLKRLPKLSPKEWQERAKADVYGVLKVVFPDREFKIIFVKNASGPNLEHPARYQVRMDSVAASKEIRDRYATFFPKGRDERPEPLKSDKISIRNRLTHESRIRLMVLRVLGDHYHDSNPGSKVQLIRYTSRPTLKITPPEGANDRRVQSFNYIEAVKSLPISFSSEELEPILKEIKPKWYGKVKSLFIVLSDDMIKKKFGPRGATHGGPGRSEASAAEAVETEDTSSDPRSSKGGKGKGTKAGNKRGHPSSSSGVPEKQRK